MNNTAAYELPLSYALIPYPSYVAIACIGAFIIFLVVGRLLVTVETQQSDLVLFNKSQQSKQVLLLVSKQLYNSTAAANNIASAIANGLMEPPPNYDMSKMNANGPNFKGINNLGDISAKINATTVALDKGTSNFDSFEVIEPAKPSNKRSKW